MKDFVRLAAAVERLYRAAHWTADRPCDADKLWSDVRDAAGIEPGQSPKPIAERAVPIGLAPRPTQKKHCFCDIPGCPNEGGDLCDAAAQRRS